MSATIKTEAIVFKKKSLLGKDTIITLFTDQEGKVAVIAKGIKKITSRRSSHIQTGNLIMVSLSDHHDRYYLQESQIITAFSDIKSNSEKIDYQYLLFFILDRMLPDGQCEPELYKFTRQFLISLARSSNFLREDLVVKLHELLYILGYHKGTTSLSELLRYVEEIIHEKIPSDII